jgi:hypothetical protein
MARAEQGIVVHGGRRRGWIERRRGVRKEDTMDEEVGEEEERMEDRMCGGGE